MMSCVLFFAFSELALPKANLLEHFPHGRTQVSSLSKPALTSTSSALFLLPTPNFVLSAGLGGWRSALVELEGGGGR